MDLLTTAKEMLDLQHEQEIGLDLKVLFVAPAPRELPEDQVLSYQVITSIYEFRDIEARSCVLIADDMFETVELVSQHPDKFGVRLVRIEGLPGANYSVGFDGAVWNTDRVSYNALISEINMVRDAEEASRIKDMSVHDVERQQYTRADGSVKDNTNFLVSDEAVEE